MSALAKIASRSICCLVSQHFQHIREIPPYFSQLAGMLSAQSPFKGVDALIGHDPKVIFLKDERDAKICEILSKNVCVLTGNRSLMILGFPHGPYHSLFDASGTPINKAGVVMGSEQTIKDLPSLERFYHQVLSMMSGGWMSAKPEDHPGILLKEDPEQFALFTKKRALTEEDTFIHLLAAKFTLSNDVRCCSELDTTYLWIRKSALSAVKEKLGLQLE
jgi:hypothetical protein